ncbi:MAG: valine--tRNA ligase [Bacteroidales bacterium]
MEIASKYDPSIAENRWYRVWIERGYFKSVPDDREPYVITIPPPNVTGVLHMGHMLNNTIQDVLIRRERMRGRNVCWVPGTDHASIATEAKVVAKLKAEGVEKTSLTREEFLKHAWEWTDKHGGIILEQLKRLGASCDWDRTLFTLDDLRYQSVIKVFVDLHEKGLIYRGIRMVNWDPEAMTAVSDEEVIYSDEESRLFYVNYPVEGEDGHITIATTRPETILGDTAVCVNPDDPRYKDFIGKNVIVPMVNRSVPVIADEYVDMEFGTGCLKITPAHDINDYEIGVRHGLEVIDIFNDNGTLSEKAQLFVGTDRFEARRLSEERLISEGVLEKTELYRNKIGRSERTSAVIEPKLSMQWFLKMEDLSRPALDAVLGGDIAIHPPKFRNVYRHWMENVRDWCISRQLWWGHRIPAWYYGNGEFVVADTADEALAKAKRDSGNSSLTFGDLRQDEDVLDTWFSSWLWPLVSFNGIMEPDNEDIKYYYPTHALITAPEILFFWVARMIIAGYEYRGEKPFSDVYLHGIVRDKQRRKMSKSLGNSPDPLDLISQYGADGVRVGMLLCSPAGNDLLYDDSLPEQGRNFANKIWNAFRLVNGWKIDESVERPQWSEQAEKWFESRLHHSVNSYNDLFEKFRISEALMVVYRLFWDDFSGWYLEIVKPDFEKGIDPETYRVTMNFIDALMRLIHPFMPFITEEIWHLSSERSDNESLMISPMPEAGRVDSKLLTAFERAQQLVSSIRSLRREKNIPNRESIDLVIASPADKGMSSLMATISRLAGIGQVSESEVKPEGSVTIMVGTDGYYIPVGERMDIEAEVEKLNNELQYTRGFLEKVMVKLSNERFVNNAPSAVVETEKQKRDDALSRIASLEARIDELGK